MENRYDKYKDSRIAWIGEIPEHWEVAKIKSFYNVILGKMVERNNDSNTGDENYLCAANIKWNGVDTEINKKMYFSDIEKEKYLLQYNDVLIMEGGMAGTACLYKNEFSPCYVQNSVNVCRAKKDFNNKFLYYWMYVPYYNGYIDAICNKATIRHYTKEKVQNTPILISSLVEQQSIVAYLDQKCGEIDELITLQEEMITKLQSYKQSVITEAVTKGLNKNVPLKDSGIEWIGKIPEHWILKRIKNICDNLDYLREPISAEHRSRNNPIYDYYGASGVIDKIDFYNVDDQVLLIGEDGANLVMRNLPLVYKANGKFWVNNHAHILKPKNDNYDFCAYAFEAADYSLFITGSAQPKLSQENLGRIKIAIPPFLEQQAIVNYLDKKCSEIDELISIKQQKIEKLKEYKKSLIFECVTGKRKVS